MQISLDSYRVFYHVAQYRSFTKAAELLYSNQPNVTRTIKNLEQALGCSLFHRSSRSVRLTPEGEELFSHIAPAMHQITAGEEALALHTSLQGGTVRVGVTEAALHHLLLPVLERFRKEYPGIRLKILNSNSHQAMMALKERQVDFSLLTLPVSLEEPFSRTDLFRFQEVPVCSPSLAVSLPANMTVSDLVHYPLVSLCKGSSTHGFYEAWFRSYGAEFAPDIEAATSDQILPMVRHGLGIGFISENTARAAEKAGEIVIPTLDYLPPVRTISLIKNSDMPLSIAASKLNSMLLHNNLNGACFMNDTHL